MAVEWRLYDVSGDVYDDRLLDVSDCTLAYNRFARSATVELDDPDGTVPQEYPRPTPVELEVRVKPLSASYGDTYGDNYGGGTGWDRRFGGFVTKTNSEQNTATLELLSHDAWLRSRDVYRSFTDTAKSTIMKELVTDLTPLTWDSTRVDVYNDDPITASWSGVRLDKVLGELSSASNDELFGGTDDRVFFFEQRDSDRSARDFTEGEYFDASFEKDGSTELNEVTVYYGGNPASDAVVVEDRESQKALGDELGTGGEPVVISTSKTFTDISAEERARQKGNGIINDASEILTGNLTTWEAFNVDPGDICRVVVPDQSIDREFRVAEISHSWLNDETTLKLAENSDGVVDTLVELSDEVSRVEARAADNNATITRFTTLDLPFEIAWTINAYKRTVPDNALILGSHRAGLGDPDAGGGLLGDRRGSREKLL